MGKRIANMADIKEYQRVSKSNVLWESKQFLAHRMLQKRWEKNCAAISALDDLLAVIA